MSQFLEIYHFVCQQSLYIILDRFSLSQIMSMSFISHVLVSVHVVLPCSATSFNDQVFKMCKVFSVQLLM